MSDERPEEQGSTLEQERARRLGRIDEMREAGTNPYPYRFDRTHTRDL